MNYQDCLREIDQLQGLGIRRGLERVQEALKILGDPHKCYPTIQVAGTNGKGSTSAMIAEILKQSQYKTGLTLSPHIADYRERIQINGEWIPKEELITLHQTLKKKLVSVPLTYFEWTIVMAFAYFAKQGVDIAVLETGMGGRWDATNAASSLIGVITNVHYDHQAILGESLEEILTEKMQILKPGMVAWTGIEDPGLLAILKNHCHARGIILHEIGNKIQKTSHDTFSFLEYHELKCNLPGQHQIQNACLAIGVVHSLQEKGFCILKESIKEGLNHSYLPGRLETIHSSPQVILDGAHNLAGIKALTLFLKTGGKKYHLVFTTLNDRPFESMVSSLLPDAKSVWWTLINEKRALQLEELKRYVAGIHYQGVSQIKEMTPETWEDYLKNISPDETIVVSGSLYLVSKVYVMMKEGYENQNAEWQINNR